MERCRGCSGEDRDQMTNIFVGNLSYATTQEELQDVFGGYGVVERVGFVGRR